MKGKEFKYVFDRFPGHSASHAAKYLHMMIDFFKSYKVTLLPRTETLNMGGDAGDPNNYAKPIDGIWTNAQGLIISKHDISVHIQDKPGAISIISAILAANSISIKNIGINHNREKGEGALNISFYDANSCEMARKLLKEYNYRII